MIFDMIHDWIGLEPILLLQVGNFLVPLFQVGVFLVIRSSLRVQVAVFLGVHYSLLQVAGFLGVDSSQIRTIRNSRSGERRIRRDPRTGFACG